MNSENKYHFHKSEYLIHLISKKSQNLFLSKQLMCSEAVLTTLNSGLFGGLDPDMVIRLTSGLPEGIGGSGCTCGALTGGVIALGLFLGRDTPGWWNNNKIMGISKEFHQCFKSRFGATCCRVLSTKLKHGSKEKFQKGSEIVSFSSEQTARILFREKPALIKSADESYLEKFDSPIPTALKKGS
jgi:C_GCAxxG_C_C family probable redox protein